MPIVQTFVERHPRLYVSIELTNRVIDLIADGYDLAIRTGHLSDSRLIGTRIASRRLHACASPAYLERHGAPATVTDLARHDCLVGASATWHFKVDGGDVLYRPKGRWRCNSGAAIADAAQRGMGICQLPDFYINAHLRAGLLAPVLEGVRGEDQPIWAVYPQRRHLSPKVKGLVAALRGALGPALAGASKA